MLISGLVFTVANGSIKAKMWVEGIGDVPLIAGTFLRIPKGTLHQPHDIEEDFVAHDTWYPALA